MLLTGTDKNRLKGIFSAIRAEIGSTSTPPPPLNTDFQQLIKTIERILLYRWRVLVCPKVNIQRGG